MRFVVLFLSLLSSPSHAGLDVKPDPCPRARLTSTAYDGNIENLLLGIGGPPVTSVAQLLDCLPEEFFRQENATYVTRSESPEKAEVSAAYPRPILSDDSAATVLAYTAMPGGKFSNELRLIVRDDGPPLRNRFLSVSFAGGRADVHESDRDCFACHRGGHLWGQYRNWDGTFARKSDLEWVEEDRSGFESYASFREKQQASPFYRRAIHLARGDDGPAPIGSHAFQPRQPYSPSMGYFLERITAPHAKRVAEKLAATPLFGATKFLLAGVFLGCPMGKRIEDDLVANLQSYFPGDPAMLKLAEYLPQLHQHGPDPYYREQAKVELLTLTGRMLGVAPEDWTTERVRPAVRADFLREDAGPAMGLGSGAEIRDRVFAVLLKNIAKDEPTLHKSAAALSKVGGYGLMLNERYRDRIDAGYRDLPVELCTALRPLIESEFAKRVTVPLRSQAPHVTLVTGCQSCHDGSGAAPTIPFGDTNAFRDWLAKTERGLTGRARLVDHVFRLRDMPPGGLSEAELQRVRDELALLGVVGPMPGPSSGHNDWKRLY